MDFRFPSEESLMIIPKSILLKRTSSAYLGAGKKKVCIKNESSNENHLRNIMYGKRAKRHALPTRQGIDGVIKMFSEGSEKFFNTSFKRERNFSFVSSGEN